MKEYITMCIGQAGVQIGDTCFQQFAREHGIQPDGKLSEEAEENGSQGNTNIFFDEDQAGKYTPRSILIDSEPDVIDYI